MKKLLSLVLAMVMVCGLGSYLPSDVAAAENTMTFEEFIEAVENGNGTFDGQGVTVKWEPDEKLSVIHRVQEPNAQYQLFNDIEDVKISNTNFEYVPGDIPNHSDGWSGLNKDWTKDQIRNAEFQFLNSGDVTVENCNFEKIIVSPYGDRENDADRTFTVTGSSFSNVYNAYALKDIYPATAKISDNTFTNCSGAIYFEGPELRKELNITNNTFDHIDEYAASGKENTRGIIQFSSANVFDETTVVVFEGSEISGNEVVLDNSETGMPVIRALSDLGAVTLEGWNPGDAMSIKADAAITLPDLPSGTSLKDGATYTFKGWAKSADYLGPYDLTNLDKLLKAGDTAENGEFYYAVYEVKYTITYKDGANGDVFADEVHGDLNAGDATPEFGGTLEREGYEFVGWNPEVSETVEGNAIYTAVWEKVEEPVTEPEEPQDPQEPSEPSEPSEDETKPGEIVVPGTGVNGHNPLWSLIALGGIGTYLVYQNRKQSKVK